LNREHLNKLSKIILDSSIEVHRNLGPGLLESVYEVCLCKELNLRNINLQRQVSLPVEYKNEKLDADFGIDVLVETYLKLADKRLGFLINFNVPKLVDGFKRRVNNF